MEMDGIGWGMGQDGIGQKVHTKHEPHNPTHKVENACDQIAREAEDGLDGREAGVEDAGDDFEERGEKVGDAGCEGGHGGGSLVDFG